jgi:tRNA pseudouridine55 synthase
MDGILLVLKPPGMTSFDVVAWLRGIIRIKKIGHGGTLDPAACGLLPVCIGKATKTMDWFHKFDKSYRAEMILGIVTDTQDGEGTVIAKKPARVDISKLQSVLDKFKGEYEQIPPMFSAVKVGGKRLYDLARKGKVIERPPRKVKISSLEIISAETDQEHPVIRFDVNCSKGTYIRTLCSDIGEALGCGAHMSFLVRTRVGPFSVENAATLEEIARCRNEGTLKSLLLSADSIFFDNPAIYLEEKDSMRLLSGAAITIYKDRPAGGFSHQNDLEIIRVYSKPDIFIGLGRIYCNKGRVVLKPYKLFK